jgi:hemerythrin-like domain-containing protein
MTTTKPAEAATTLDGFEVLDDCHARMLAALDDLRTLAQRLEFLGADAEARTMAREIGSFFSVVARQHHEDEERHVFPKLLTGGEADIQQAVLRLQQDHGWIEEDWLEISPQLDALAMGMSSYDVDELKAAIEVFVALTQEHIALEESLIYPKARGTLLPLERVEMAREMAARRRAARKGAGAAK